MKSKSYNNSKKSKKVSNSKGRETTAFIPHKNPKPVLDKIVDSFREVTNSAEVEQVLEQKAVVIDCPCCVNNCQCCDHKSGTVGHKCTCRCHS